MAGGPNGHQTIDRHLNHLRDSLFRGEEDIVVKLSGELRGELVCECVRRHMIEIADGEMRVHHR